jgi:hypothetical protein
MDRKERILRNVSLGVDPPENETDEERAWRMLMEKQVEENRDHGLMNDIPWNG